MSVLDQIRQTAVNLLEKGEVQVIIGYSRGTFDNKCTPFFARDVQDVENLIWEKGCDINLANYLLKTTGKVGITAKGCETRSIINLIKENQVKKDRVVIIGATCPSMESCGKCSHPEPIIADIIIEEKHQEAGCDFSDVEKFSKFSARERRDYIYKEVSKCIRCYACRNVCPACYCKECFVEENLPAWVGKKTDVQDNLIFHLTRVIHVAGRCVDCGECVRACPMGVDLSILNKKVALDVKELFGVESGLDPNSELPLNEFKDNDPQPFLLGGGTVE